MSQQSDNRSASQSSSKPGSYNDESADTPDQPGLPPTEALSLALSGLITGFSPSFKRLTCTVNGMSKTDRSEFIAVVHEYQAASRLALRANERVYRAGTDVLHQRRLAESLVDIAEQLHHVQPYWAALWPEDYQHHFVNPMTAARDRSHSALASQIAWKAQMDDAVETCTAKSAVISQLLEREISRALTDQDEANPTPTGAQNSRKPTDGNVDSFPTQVTQI